MVQQGDFQVNLDLFRGPLNLLLYLVRKHELEVTDIPVAIISEQYLEYLEVLQQLDINAVGDFLDIASTLTEIKSRMVLPRVIEDGDAIEDPREELVHRLLEYKQYRDVSLQLEMQAREWQQRNIRLANDLPPRRVNVAEQPIQDVELWDLVSAIGRILKDSEQINTTVEISDDTPIHVYMKEIHRRILHNGRTSFTSMFVPGMHKSAIIGVFLAILELVRHHNVTAEQDGVHGDIWLNAAEGFDQSLDVTNVEEYDAKTPDQNDMPHQMR